MNTVEDFYSGMASVVQRIKPLVPPPFAFRPICRHTIQTIAKRHPEIFDRLGPHAGKSYLIDPTDMPYVLRLVPRRVAPTLEPIARTSITACDATISGTLSKLVALVESREDGDALFFSRDLTFSGDTEAVLALRNAIDDAEISLVEEIESLFGPLKTPLRLVRRKIADALHALGHLPGRTRKST